jgi:hypothetical protein
MLAFPDTGDNMAWRMHQQNAAFSANLNVHPAFGNLDKVKRNRILTSSVMKINYGKWHIGQGEKPLETTNDPLKRTPEHIIARGREEMSIAGRMRGNIRPANPALVNWKYPYYRATRPPNIHVIGPFTQGSLEQQSILYRMSDAIGKLGGG